MIHMKTPILGHLQNYGYEKRPDCYSYCQMESTCENSMLNPDSMNDRELAYQSTVDEKFDL